jgi:hypothetical protein
MTLPPDEPGEQAEDRPAPPATARGGALKRVSDTVVSPTLSVSNPFAAGAIVVGVIGLVFSALGVVPTIGVIVSVLGLVRSTRLSREGEARTGRWQSVVGLVLSLLGLLRLLPFVAALLPHGLLG